MGAINMTFYEIPLQNIASQIVNITVDSSIVKIRVKALQDIEGVFIDVSINNENIIVGAHCKPGINILNVLHYKLAKSPMKSLFFTSNSKNNGIHFSDLGNKVRLYYAVQ